MLFVIAKTMILIYNRYRFRTFGTAPKFLRRFQNSSIYYRENSDLHPLSAQRNKSDYRLTRYYSPIAFYGDMKHPRKLAQRNPQCPKNDPSPCTGYRHLEKLFIGRFIRDEVRRRLIHVEPVNRRRIVTSRRKIGCLYIPGDLKSRHRHQTIGLPMLGMGGMFQRKQAGYTARNGCLILPASREVGD